MKEELNISLIQSNIFWQDRAKNLAHFTKIISTIKHADIILLPEMFNTAFCPKSTDLAEEMTGDTVSWIKNMAKRKKSAVTGSLMIKENEKIYNRLVWVSKNGRVFTYDKRHLFSSRRCI